MTMLTLTVMTISSKDLPVLSSIRASIIDGSGPIGRVGATVTSPVRSLWGRVDDYDEVRADNERLREEIDRLRAKQIRNANAASELEKLKSLEGIEFIGEIPSRVAAVASGPYSSFDDNTLMLDRGASSGFRDGMPVVTDAGLVGRLESVTDKRSLVRLITDPEFFVSVKLASSGWYGLGHGNGTENPFVVDEDVDLDLPVDKGDFVVTSGIESAQFPKDLIIGEVTAVSVSGSSLSQVLDVELAVDFRRLSVVRVLLWEPPT